MIFCFSSTFNNRAEVVMKFFTLVYLIILNFGLSAVEIVEVVASPAKNNAWEESIGAVIDGDLEKAWTKNYDQKIELIVFLNDAVKLKSLNITWGEIRPQYLEVKFKVKGRKKKAGPNYDINKGDVIPSILDLSDLNVSTRQVHIWVTPPENKNVISIKEITINQGVMNTEIVKDSGVTTHKDEKKLAPNQEVNSTLELEKPKVDQDQLKNDSNGDVPKIIKTKEKIFI
jgi:hypothetical protein